MTETPAAAAPMSPGTYIRKRREAAELTVDAVGAMLPSVFGEPNAILGLLLRLEAHALTKIEPSTHFALIEALQGAFNFDRNVYFALLIGAIADPATPLPPICRVCACTEFDPCIEPIFEETCGWANVPRHEAPLCTMCIGEPDPDQSEALSPPANDGAEVRDAA